MFMANTGYRPSGRCGWYQGLRLGLGEEVRETQRRVQPEAEFSQNMEDLEDGEISTQWLAQETGDGFM